MAADASVTVPLVQWAAVGAVAAAAAVTDVRTGRVPNVLTLGAAAAALVFYGVSAGGSGLITSALGVVVGLSLFLPFFVLGGMGGGDVKLLAALGGWLGPIGAVKAAVCAALAGGILAMVVALGGGYVREAFRNLSAMAWVWRTVGPSPIPEMTLARSRGPRLAYAVPIGIGALAALWLGNGL
jgi:prepilin peptidase CpaA